LLPDTTTIFENTTKQQPQVDIFFSVKRREREEVSSVHLKHLSIIPIFSNMFKVQNIILALLFSQASAGSLRPAENSNQRNRALSEEPFLSYEPFSVVTDHVSLSLCLRIAFDLFQTNNILNFFLAIIASSGCNRFGSETDGGTSGQRYTTGEGSSS
jgi:hypothetical protein